MTQSNTVYMTTTLDSSPVQIPIRFADRVRNRRNNIWDYDDEDHFGIWSCKFSAGGNEVIAGGSGMIFGSFLAIIYEPCVAGCERTSSSV